MKDFKVLKLLDKFRGIFIKLGIDYDVMRKILQVKLIMDGRRVPTVIGNSNKRKDDEDKNKFLGSLWIYILMGLIAIPFVAVKQNYIFQMSFVFGIMIFMVMTSLISDFSSVLLDIRDINIIGSKPVSSKTLNTAKLIHILIYMSMITLATSAPALITAVVRQGALFLLIFIIEIILMDLFIVVLTALLYLLILRFFDGEKLKDIINYVQIILSIALAVGYQLIGRLFEFTHISTEFIPKWWQYFIIPVWFGAPFEVLIKGSYNMNYIVFSLLALIIPLISILIYAKLMPAFEKNLQKLGNNSSKGSRDHKGFNRMLSNILCRNKQERTFFIFTLDILKNEREFKLKVYPSLGFALVFPFIFLFNSIKGESFASIASSKLYLNIYFCAMLLPTVVMMMKYSGKYKAAWVYRALPIKEIASIFKGTIKAYIVRLFIPIYLLDCIVFMAIFGVRILPDLIIVFLNIILFTIICFRFMKKALPFSVAYGSDNQGEGTIMIPLMIILGVLAFVHYECTKVNYAIYIYMAALLFLVIILWKKSFNISWENLN